MPAPLHLHSFVDLWHPGVLSLALLLITAYLFTVGPLRRRLELGPPLPLRMQAAGVAGLALIYVAEGTPLHILSEQYLFSAHMVQHLLLTMVMAPLVLLGTPDWLVRLPLRLRPVTVAARWLTRPVLALVLFNLVYSIWHLPVLYNTALVYHWFHMVQHALLVPAALLMWWPLLSPAPELPRLPEPAQLLYIFLVGVSQMAAFGAVTFAEHVLYGEYAQAPRVWGLSAAADQQLAGAIMKVGGMSVLLIGLGVIFFPWAYREERQGRATNATSGEVGGGRVEAGG